MKSPLFQFESEFVDSLRCIPMVVRKQLDVSGVKLKLNEWSKLSQAQRLTVVHKPCDTAEEVSTYRYDLSVLITATCGAPPSMLAELPEPVWETGGAVPDQVVQQAKSLGQNVSQASWAALSPLQRFALIKLSRPGHENRNFLPALTEFGLAKPTA